MSILSLFTLVSLIFGGTGVFLLLSQLFSVISRSFSTNPILIIIGALATILGIISYFYHKRVVTIKNRIDELEEHLELENQIVEVVERLNRK